MSGGPVKPAISRVGTPPSEKEPEPYVFLKERTERSYTIVTWLFEVPVFIVRLVAGFLK
jgi:hypothetical protein